MTVALILLLQVVVLLGATAGSYHEIDAFPKSVRSMGLGGIKAAPLLGRSEGLYEASSQRCLAKFDFSAIQGRLPFGDDLFFIGVGAKLLSSLSIRAGWAQLAGSEVEITSLDSISDADTIAYKLDSKIDVSDFVATAVFQFEPIESLYTAIAIKWIKVGSHDFQMQGASSDFGLSIPNILGNVSIGCLIRNVLQTGLFRADVREELPTEGRVGVTYSGSKNSSAFYLEFGLPLMRKSNVSKSLESVAGVEWSLSRFIQLRSAISMANFSANTAFSFGLSFLLKGLYIDYALVSSDAAFFSGGHRIGIGYAIN